MEFARATVGFLTNQQASNGVWSQPEAVRHIVIGLASFAFRSATSSDAIYESQSHPLFFAFLSQVEQSYTMRRESKWYAETLDCSYRTLSRLCRDASGETPKIIIDRRVATEARRLLAFTRNSANAIGATLGFTEPTNRKTRFEVRRLHCTVQRHRWPLESGGGFDSSSRTYRYDRQEQRAA